VTNTDPANAVQRKCGCPLSARRTRRTPLICILSCAIDLCAHYRASCPPSSELLAAVSAAAASASNATQRFEKHFRYSVMILS
jgi:hypothetical protein